MQHSPSIVKLAAALTKASAEIENATKNATNPHFKNQYADLPEIINTVRPVLAANGLALVQLPGYAEGIATVEGVLMHESGEWIAGTAGSRVPKDDPQGVGSATTYLRRYQAAAMLFIGQEDDDGEMASQPAKKAAPAKPAPSKTADADKANLATGRALWIEAAGLGLEESPDAKVVAGMKNYAKALDNDDAQTVVRGMGWLREIIQLAKADGQLTGLGV